MAGLVALGIVVALAGLLIAVLPQKSKSHDLDSQIAALQTKLVSLQAGGSRAPAIRAADLFALARAMPDTIDMPSIVLDLARAAAASHTTIASITPATAVAQPDGSLAVPVRVEVTGTWAQVTSLLHGLRQEVRTTREQKLRVAGRLFVVDNVQLTSSAAGGVDAVLSLDAFSYGVPPVVTASTDTTSTTTAPSGSVQAAGAGGSGG